MRMACFLFFIENMNMIITYFAQTNYLVLSKVEVYSYDGLKTMTFSVSLPNFYCF